MGTVVALWPGQTARRASAVHSHGGIQLMKRSTMRYVLSASCILLCAVAANADQLSEASDAEFAEMRALVVQLQQQVSAHAEQIEAQRIVIQEAQKREASREASPEPDPFFSSIEVGGWVATSWWYNFNDPRGDALANANQGSNGTFYPFHPDSNSFQVDQVWFEIEKPVTRESRAGFRVDMAHGLTAAQLGGPSARAGGYSANSFNLYQAYVQYLVPFGDVKLRAGKFATLLGAEVAQTAYNWNVTRGNVYNLLQPITHYGVIFDGEFGNFSWSIGGVNSGDCCGLGPDNNGKKSLLVGASYRAETFSAGTSLQWGVANFGDNSATGTFDLLASWEPTERFSAWLNFDYKWAPDNSTFPGSSPDGWGLAVAGRVEIIESLGFALRGEVLEDNDQLFGISDSGAGSETEIWSLTGTLDWEIYKALVAKIEVRYDAVSIHDGNDHSVFVDSHGGFSKSDQIVGGFELAYMF
jgi:hypothetical protein